jgi:hypothetical protein
MGDRPLIVSVLGGLGSCAGTLVTILALVPMLTDQHVGTFYLGGTLNWSLTLLGATVVFVSWEFVRGRRYAWQVLVAYTSFSAIADLLAFTGGLGLLLSLFSFCGFPMTILLLSFASEDFIVYYCILVVMLVGHLMVDYLLLRPSVRSYFQKKETLPPTVQALA